MEIIFEKIELPRVSEEAGKKIAVGINKPWDEAKKEFDGTPGSILLPLEEIKNRFRDYTDEEKTILRTLRNLWICGIYEERQVFPLEWVKIATKKGIEELRGLLELLKGKELIIWQERGRIQAEEVYLKDIFKPPWGKEIILNIFEEMITTFSGIPEALFRLGNRAYNDGIIVLEKAKYMKIAIRAYNEALKVFTKEEFPEIYPRVEGNLKRLLIFCGGHIP